MKDFGDLMKQAAGLQAKMQAAQETIKALEIEGSAGGGSVRVLMTGGGYAKRVFIDPSLLAPAEGELLEDLVAAAINDAKSRLDVRSAEVMSALTAGLPLPPGLLPRF